MDAKQKKKNWNAISVDFYFSFLLVALLLPRSFHSVKPESLRFIQAFFFLFYHLLERVAECDGRIHCGNNPNCKKLGNLIGKSFVLNNQVLVVRWLNRLNKEGGSIWKQISRSFLFFFEFIFRWKLHRKWVLFNGVKHFLQPSVGNEVFSFWLIAISSTWFSITFHLTRNFLSLDRYLNRFAVKFAENPFRKEFKLLLNAEIHRQIELEQMMQ